MPSQSSAKLPKTPAHAGLHVVGKPFAHSPPGSSAQQTRFIYARGGGETIQWDGALLQSVRAGGERCCRACR